MLIFISLIELLFSEKSKVLLRDAAGNEHALSLKSRSEAVKEKAK